MARALYEASPAARAALDEAEATLPGLLDLMWEGPAEDLQATANQQPALVAAGAAALAAWREAGGAPITHAAGHSLGEYTALVAAGSLTLADALRLVRARGEAMQRAVPAGEGAMAAVMKLGADGIEAILEEVDGVVEIANRNSPQQTVISGAAAAVADASERLKAAGARAIPLKVSAPFHCSLMAPAAAELAPLLLATRFDAPALPVIANVSADVVASGADARALLERQVTAPVRWVETLQHLHALGVRRFVEFGSGAVLTGLVGRTLEGVTATSVTDPESLRSTLDAITATGAHAAEEDA
ncbi:MAG: [acyl-carrier-protein] S-malonyltransferase [Trueperaceae bacterium]|nr:MAG: [acyl-carrier-protein] S-malonyltransferase [Trueperaceae bacterium]